MSKTFLAKKSEIYHPRVYRFLCETTDGATGQELKWWQTTLVYQIYPRSFQDSNGDGIGDLKGIQSRLDYLQFLNVETIWLSPIYLSPMKDFGYDVTDFRAIDPIFGTMEDFDSLLQDVHARGMKLIIDVVPNHTSDLHTWFKQSRSQSEDNPYKDYYIWSDGVKVNGERRPPNNWLSVFGGSAWEYDQSRDQYYLHQFLKEQPDLNYRNPLVCKEMEAVLRFWLDKGVDGFRVDAIDFLFENEDLSLNEPVNVNSGATSDMYEYLRHIYTLNQPEIYDVISSWNDILKEYSENTGKERFMIAEVYDRSSTKQKSMLYYGPHSTPFNFDFIDMCSTNFTGAHIHAWVRQWMDNMPPGDTPTWVLGNHDNSRVASRVGLANAAALNLMMLLLPGSPTTYNGEEIGMTDVAVTFEQTQDPFGKRFGKELYPEFSRDPERSPMQWNSDIHAGFSLTDPWLPVGKNVEDCNVQVQQHNPNSILNTFRQAAKLRQQEPFQSGDTVLGSPDDNVFSFLRIKQDYSPHLVVINIGKDQVKSNLSSGYGSYLPAKGNVVLCTMERVGDLVDLKNIVLRPGEGLVIKAIIP